MSILMFTAVGFSYVVWAAVVSNSLFHRVWSFALLCSIVSANVLLTSPISTTTIPLAVFAILSVWLSFALSPIPGIWESLAEAPEPSEWDHKIIEVINPEPEIGTQDGPLQSNILADIVAVHDLGTNPRTTWQSPKASKQDGEESPSSKPMWLRDFLPREKGLNARVIIFNHNSAWETHALNKSLHDHGGDLLFALRRVRQTDEEKQRPIVFIGHGFGGLIIKQALVSTGEDTTDEFCSNIRQQAQGFVFLGTPHRGTSFSLRWKLVSLFGFWRGSSTSLLEVVEPGSSINQLLHDSFMSFLRGYRRLDRTLCVFESMKESFYGFPLTHVVDKDSAIIDGSRRVGFETQHHGIQRFLSQYDENYQHILFWIRKWIQESNQDSLCEITDSHTRTERTHGLYITVNTEESLGAKAHAQQACLQSMAFVKMDQRENSLREDQAHENMRLVMIQQ
ncbi:hypothetical protein TWF696_001751 [Orbilia brochopaga]|uniref:DUF676 domain-containing protein n=1 Tax=Orbilia brochopaga TaxID=3140254 RepID=A0AAV9U6C1_9PEZI